MERVTAPTSLPPLSRSLEPTRAPKFRVYKNGDAFFTGRQVVLRKPAPSLGVLMDIVTDSLHGEILGIRRLYTPQTGTRVTSLDQLKDGASYVAASQEPFRKMNYIGIPTLRQREMTFKHEQMKSPLKRNVRQPTFHRDPVTALTNQPKIVAFVRNGDLSAVPFRVIFTKRNTMNWDQVCQIISDKVRMESAVRKVYTIGGRMLHSAAEFESGETYVAVARIPFRKLAYQPASPIRSPTRRKKLPPISRKVARVKPRPRPPPPQALPTTREPLPPVPKPTARIRAPGPPPKIRPQSYIVTVITGDEPGAATDAKVAITLFGSRGETGARTLNDQPGYFAVGAVDTFAIEAAGVGRLQRIRIEHDGSGRTPASSAWFCKSVAVRDTITDEVAMFVCERWLAEDRGSYLAVAEIEVAVLSPSPTDLSRSKLVRVSPTTDLTDDYDYGGTAQYDVRMHGGSMARGGITDEDDRLRRAHAADLRRSEQQGDGAGARESDTGASDVVWATEPPLDILDDDASLARGSPDRIALGSPVHGDGLGFSGDAEDEGGSDVEPFAGLDPLSATLTTGGDAEDGSTGTTAEPDAEGPTEAESADARRHAAATTIQARYRGYRVRKARSESVAEPSSEAPAEQGDAVGANHHAAATVIQSAYRGHRTRRALKAANPETPRASVAATLEEADRALQGVSPRSPDSDPAEAGVDGVGGERGGSADPDAATPTPTDGDDEPIADRTTPVVAADEEDGGAGSETETETETETDAEAQDESAAMVAEMMAAAEHDAAPTDDDDASSIATVDTAGPRFDDTESEAESDATVADGPPERVDESEDEGPSGADGSPPPTPPTADPPTASDFEDDASVTTVNETDTESMAGYDGESVVRLGDTQRDFRNKLHPFVACQSDVRSLVADPDRITSVWAKIPKSARGQAGVDDVATAVAAELPVLSNHASAFAAASGGGDTLIEEGDLRWVVFKAYFCAAIDVKGPDGSPKRIGLRQFKELAESFKCTVDSATLTNAFGEMTDAAGKADPDDVATWIAKAKFPEALSELSEARNRS